MRYGGDLINQLGFPKGRLCLINLVTFCVGVTALVEKGRTTDVIYLDFCKAFDVVLHHVLIFALEKSVFEEWTIQWIRYWLYVARGFLSMALGRGWSQVVCPRGLSWRAVIFTIFINDMEIRIKSTPSRFVVTPSWMVQLTLLMDVNWWKWWCLPGYLLQETWVGIICEF